MSKAIKSIGRAVKKAVKWVAKNIVPILAVAALVYTGGAAMGFFQGVAGGGGATGLAGIQAAWGGGAAAASSAGTASAAAEGVAATAGTTAVGTAASTTAAGSGVTMGASGALSVGAAAPTLPAGLMAPGSILGAPAAATAAGGGGIGVGTALLASTGVSAGGALLQAKATEDAAEEERARQEAEKAEYNRNMYAFGVNREGKQDANYTGGDWDSVMRAAPAGLMAPRAAAPAPQTIDDLIRARQQGAA